MSRNEDPTRNTPDQERQEQQFRDKQRQQPNDPREQREGDPEQRQVH
ncbi:hypothetical protein [Xanthomonas sp. XNM01]|nr:hypothetical protein [Xanthomonas sp. XNM01]MBD9368434.1 hypothetical protein [Xanthomonas sp. XNM01]